MPTASKADVVSSGPGWTTVGWQGVSLRVPEGFDPVAVSAEGTGGYLRLAGQDALSIEVKWDTERGSVNVPAAFERYVARLRKTARKAGQELSLRTRVKRLIGVRPSDQAPLTYEWTAEGPGARRALGAIWHCGECARLVIAELLGTPHDDFSLAAPVLRGIADHGRDGWNTWGMYGLAVEIPDGYRLCGHQLMSGYLKFVFRHRGSRLQVERWGLANVVLKEGSLRDWFTGRERERLSRYHLSQTEADCHGHPGFRLAGRERALPSLVTAAQGLATLTRPALHLESYVWECREGNRIYALTAQLPGRNLAVGTATLDEILHRLQCHCAP